VSYQRNINKKLVKQTRDVEDIGQVKEPCTFPKNEKITMVRE